MRMEIKGINDMTGTVHYARAERNGKLVQVHGVTVTQRLYLTPTDEAVTCGTCLRRKTPTTRPAPVRRETKPTSGPSSWGIFTPSGHLQTYRDTKKAAQAMAEHLGSGYTVRKLEA